MSIRSAVVGLLAVWMLVVGMTSARADDLDTARKAYKNGVQNFKLGEFEAALTNFKDAYRLRDDPTFLFNIGQCQRSLGRKREALQAFRAFLANAKSVPNRAEVEKIVEQLRVDVAAEDDEKKRKQDAADAAAAAAAAAQQAAQQQAQQQQATVAITEPPPPPRTPIYKKWWLWTAVGGVVVVGLAIGLGVGLTRASYASPHGLTDGTFHF